MPLPFENSLRENIFLGGHSYGGRQSTMLCADDPELVNGLLLLSYPLHPPRKPEQLRTQHLPNLRNPCLFVHGTRDPFGSTEEMREGVAIDSREKRGCLRIGDAGHDLKFKKGKLGRGPDGEVVQAASRILSAERLNQAFVV